MCLHNLGTIDCMIFNTKYWLKMFEILLIDRSIIVMISLSKHKWYTNNVTFYEKETSHYDRKINE